MSFFLAPLSLLYQAGLSVDRALKSVRRRRLDRPVISVGNISVGGTGKTPLVVKLLSDLKSWGYRPAVLIRGYRSESGFSDEAALLMQYHPDVPIGTGADRAASARDMLSKHKIDVFILDDGFQHWALHRDLDIVCVDGTSPWAGGHLLPHGRLREPKSALRRAGLIVVTRLELIDDKKRQALFAELGDIVDSDALLASSFASAVRNWKTGHTLMPAQLKGKKMIVLSAVGRPQAFEDGLKRMGVDVLPLRFRDHHYYKETDLKKIEDLAKKENADVITTEKDLVKLERTRWGKARDVGFHVFVAAVQHQFLPSDEKKWERAITDVLSRKA